MNHQFKGWATCADQICVLADGNAVEELNNGQVASLRAIAERLQKNSVIIADEVGMGKTRIAAFVANAVVKAQGRVVILVPPGLGYQWGDELHNAGVKAPAILRSFRQYLQAWENGDNTRPWFNESVIILSHSFTNWRLWENSDPWRWSLLPEIYARWRKHTERRWPRKYRGNKSLGHEMVRQAAETIIDAISACKKNHPAKALIQELAENIPWPDALTASEYGRDEGLRPWLEKAVGLGMGPFDLIIVDEAHKSRGEESGLTRLLTKVIMRSSETRYLAMTATPVELDAVQWKQMLKRIEVDKGIKGEVETAISNYAQAVTKVRQSLSDQGVREEYKKSAEVFEKALHPYLLRRDKREDPAVDRFRKATGGCFQAYRQEKEILIDTAGLTPNWKRAVSAAEALSFVTRKSDNTAAKRLRLTLGSGHGISAVVDQILQDEKDHPKQTESESNDSAKASSDTGIDPLDDKRLERARWWQDILQQPFAKAGTALFEHPAILAAVEEIERVCQQGEKVLVFGRFTRPLRALVQLLNAREMLRCLDKKRAWPQSKVHENDNWDAIEAAYEQLKRQGVLKWQGKLDRVYLNQELKKQYIALENQRHTIREKLIGHIEKGLNSKQLDGRVGKLFTAFKKTIAEEPQKSSHDTLAVMSRAIQELLGDNVVNAGPTDFAQAFVDLMAATSDRNEGDTDGNGELDESEASFLLPSLYERLLMEHNRPEGGYARLMYGETKAATRRLLQLAFNRKQAYPKVLVAQSLVGREGLNLHKACRTVVLLHPEWNPGVVEQQIGRVDRIGSLWEEQLNQAIDVNQSVEELPTINIRPVIFRGTYDEKNWQVLNERWDDLRAQLHGIVISSRIASKYSNVDELIDEINDAAPCFTPRVDQT
jgi:superfamily II DNA or RNA helicase